MGFGNWLYRAGSVRRRAAADAPGAAGEPTQFVYVTKESLTFPGCAAFAAIATTLVATLAGWKLPNLAVSAAVGGVVGAFLCALAIAKATTNDRGESGFWLETIGVAVINTVFLIASIQGIAAVGNNVANNNAAATTTVPATTPPPTDTTTTTAPG